MPIILDPSIPNPTAPTSVTSSDSHLTVYSDVTHAGVLLRADFHSLGTVPWKVRFLRNGVPVRSGDAAWAPGGYAVAYDHEAPLGDTSVWTAVPVYQFAADGAPSTPAAYAVPAMADDVDCWVKPVNDPGLAVAFQVHSDRVEIGWSGRTQSYAVPGRSLPIGTYDRRTMNAVSITLRTDTRAEKDALAAAMDTGPVLVQLRDTYGIDDFYAIPGDSTERYFLGMFSQLRDIPSTFMPCERPPTLDSPLFVPGHSWDEMALVAGTWDAAAATWPTWDDVLIGPVPTPDGLLAETDTGSGEGGL